MSVCQPHHQTCCFSQKLHELGLHTHGNSPVTTHCCSSLRTCTRLPAKQASHDAATCCCCHPLDVAAAATGGLDVALQQVQECDRVGQPVGQAGVVVLLPLYLTANDLQANKSNSTAREA
jgi:hypothetical protein